MEEQARKRLRNVMVAILLALTIGVNLYHYLKYLEPPEPNLEQCQTEVTEIIKHRARPVQITICIETGKVKYKNNWKKPSSTFEPVVDKIVDHYKQNPIN